MSKDMFDRKQKLVIDGEEYVASNRIGEHEKLLASFNQLAKSTYGISFQEVGGDYEPHALIQGDKVCANVSVNQMTFFFRGKKRQYIQLGTVMTHKEYRNKGLSRLLIEQIVNQWKDKCDAIYLFANDTVLDFYPKFGFLKQEEYEYIKSNVLKPAKAQLRDLDMAVAENIKLVKEKYLEGNPFSELYMTENDPIFSFYYEGFMKESVYYIDEYQVVVVAEEENDTMVCYDILGKSDATLDEILSVVASYVEKQSVKLGFTPVVKEGFLCQVHHEEDTTLFVHKDGECIMEKNKIMFPMLSHA